MPTQTLPHGRRSFKSPLQVEITTKALRHSVWVALFLSQELQLRSLNRCVDAHAHRNDRISGEFDLA